MTKLELLRKELEEKFHDDGYRIIDKDLYYHIRIKAKDGIFGGRFIKLITCLKVPFFIDCQDKTICIARYDLTTDIG